jgi:hypothetical protein
LTSPFFYQDSSDPNNSKELAFFVLPSLIQKTVIRWDGWSLPVKQRSYLNSTDYWNQVVLTPQVPGAGPVNPPDPESIYSVLPNEDLIANPAALVSFNSGLVSQEGGMILAPDGSAQPLASGLALGKAAANSTLLNPAALNGATTNLAGPSIP